MKRGDNWPDIVLTLKARDVEDHDGYPTEIEFLVFPRRDTDHTRKMVPTKIALMRRLAREFECRVIGDTRYFPHKEDYQRADESFLCQAGRFFVGQRSRLRTTNANPHWEPADDVPEAELDSRGGLVNEAATVETFERWREERWKPKPPPEPKPSKKVEAISDEEFYALPYPDPESWEDDPYLKRMSEWEAGGGTTTSKQLIERGVPLPAPDSMNDEQLHEKLWQVIRGMAETRHYLYSTNHLSDRELYTYLWSEYMNEQTMDLTGLTDCGCHLDLLGSGSDEDTFLSFKYYDGSEQRAEWMASFPDYEMPTHEDPPYDRDRLLPKRND